MIKLFFIDPQSYSNLEKYDLGLMSKFRVSGVNCNFYCSDKISVESLDGINVKKEFKYNDINNNFLKLISYFISLLGIFYDFLKSKPDIVHVQWCKFPLFDFLLYKILKFYNRKAKIIFTVHNFRPHDSSAFSWFIYKRLYNVFDVYIVHDRLTFDLLNELVDKSKIRIIEHGIIPFTDDLPISDSVRDINFDLISVCFLGYGSYYKGFDLIVESWFKDFSSNSKVQLILAGKMNKRFSPFKKIITATKNIVQFDRYMLDSELKYISENATVCILPYRKISQSGVLLSIIGSNTPFIVSNIGGLSEPLEISKVGWVLDEISINGVSNSISKIVTNIDDVQKLKLDKCKWRTLENHYSWDLISLKMVSCYQEFTK